MNRFAMAMAAYAVLAALAWFTLDDQRVRLVTVAILAMFAVRTLVRRRSDEAGRTGDER